MKFVSFLIRELHDHQYMENPCKCAKIKQKAVDHEIAVNISYVGVLRKQVLFYERICDRSLVS